MDCHLQSFQVGTEGMSEGEMERVHLLWVEATVETNCGLAVKTDVSFHEKNLFIPSGSIGSLSERSAKDWTQV